MSLDNVKYDAFISYRHCELDSFISENLHKKLESYKLPNPVIKKIGNSRTKIERVFRDEAELPLSNNLSDPITLALDNSEFLIVICTPRLKESLWCKKEIETFVSTHDRKHVLLVLAEGEPEESFPDILMYEEVSAKDENGNDITVRVDREPLAADCRGENNRQRLKALDNVVLKLCAAIFNLNYDDLRQRHRERQIRKRIIAVSIAFAIVTAFAVTCLFFTVKISRQNKVISDKYAGAMALSSSRLLSRGLRKDAVYAVRNVLPDNENEGYNPDAFKALVAAVAPYETEKCYFPAGDFRIPQDVIGFGVSDDGSYALLRCDGYFIVKDIKNDGEVCRVETEFSDSAVFSDTGVIYLSPDMQVIHRDIDTGSESVLSEEGYDVYYAAGTKTAIIFSPEAVIGLKDAKEVFRIGLEGVAISDEGYEVDNVFITDEGTCAAFSISASDGSWCGLIDITSGQLRQSIRIDDSDYVISSSDGEMLYVYSEIEDGYGGTASGTMKAVDATGRVANECDIPGFGFYKMLVSDNGILLVSDSLAYVLDEDLDIQASVTGYMDAVCEFSYKDGFVILDALGRMIGSNVYSSVDRSFDLYGHYDDALISRAVGNADKLFVEYADTGRMVIYSPADITAAVTDGTGDATPFDGNSDADIDISGLEGIEDLSVFYRAVSGDGRYIAVGANDGILYIFDRSDGRRVKEIYDTNIVLMHSVFPYLKNANVYIIENGVFDEDFNMISKLPDGLLAAIGKDQKSVVLGSPYSLDTFYDIELMSYDEIIQKADELLGDYVPGADICDRYSIDHAGE